MFFYGVYDGATEIRRDAQNKILATQKETVVAKIATQEKAIEAHGKNIKAQDKVFAAIKKAAAAQKELVDYRLAAEAERGKGWFWIGHVQRTPLSLATCGGSYIAQLVQCSTSNNFTFNTAISICMMVLC